MVSPIEKRWLCKVQGERAGEHSVSCPEEVVSEGRTAVASSLGGRGEQGEE